MRRGRLARVPALALLTALTAQPARAATVDISIVSATLGFSPSAASGPLGTTFRWTNDDGMTHTTTQNAPLSFWDSGLLGPGQPFSKTIDFAGTYAYHCTLHSLSMKGRVKVPIQVSPRSGFPSTTFMITVARVAAPSGFTFDIQKKVGAGLWAIWKTGLTSKSASFMTAGLGTYAFRSRLHKTSNGATSGWSPARSITVS